MEQIVKIDPKEYGLEESKAAQIAAQFQPMLDRMVELETEANEVFSLPIDSPATAKKAKEVRLKYVKVRTGTAEIHKQQKAFYLAGGRFVDGWKNAQVFASQGIEERLESIENHAANIEKERIAKLKAERESELSQYCENASMYPLGEMTDEAYSNLLNGQKLMHEAKIKAEEDARLLAVENALKDALAAERKILIAPYVQFQTEQHDLRELSEPAFDALIGSLQKAKSDYDTEQAAIRAENDRLKKEAEQKEAELAAERKAAQEKADKERKEAESRLAEQKRIADEQLEAARKEQQRIEQELADKKAAEEKAEADRIAAIEAEAAKGDSAKFDDLISDLQSLQTKYNFKSAKYKKLYDLNNEMLTKAIDFLNNKNK